MKSLLTLVLFVAVLAAAAYYLTDLPVFERVGSFVEALLGGTSLEENEDAGKQCFSCERSCARLYEQCVQDRCTDKDTGETDPACAEKCAGRYRACYYGCTGQFGQEECPPPSLSGVL